MLKSIALFLFVLLLFPVQAALALSAERDSTIFPVAEIIHEDDDVVVTASRYDDAVHLSRTNITAAELKFREPDLPIPMLLQDVPGVFSYSDAGSGLGYTYLKIRGFDQRRVGVLINGIPFNDPEDHQLWWVNMPDFAASLEDVQVQRGVTNSMGGLSAMGGTVNLETSRMRDQQSGRVTFAGGSYGFNQQALTYHTGDLKGGFRSMARLSRQNSDGYRQRSAVDQWGVFWSGLWESDRSTLQMNIYTGRELTHHAWDSSPASELAKDRTHNPEAYHNAVDNFRQPHYELHHSYYLNDALTFKNSVYYVKGEGYYENFKDEERAGDYGLDLFLGLDPDDEVDLVRQKWVRKEQVGWAPRMKYDHGNSRLVVGGDLYNFHSNHWGDVLGVEGFTPWDFTDGDFKYHHYTGEKDAFSVYVNEMFRPTESLTLMADLQFQHKRYDMMQEEAGNFVGDLRNAYQVTYDFFNPKGAIHYQFPGEVAGGRVASYASVGVSQREPADNDLFDTWQGADDLGVTPLFGRSEEVRNPSTGQVEYVRWFDPLVKEEKVVDYEAGVSVSGQRVSFTLGGYWMDFTDEIVPYGGVDEDGYGIRGNAGKTLHRGLELGLRAKVATQHDLIIAASRSWDEFDEFIFTDYDGTQTDYSNNPIALFPEHLLSAAWRSRLTNSFVARMRVRNVGRQYLDNTGNESRSIEPWTTVDLSLWFDLGATGLNWLDGATAYLHLRNLGDVEYETTGYYNPWGGADYSGENHYTPGAGRNFALGVNYDF